MNLLRHAVAGLVVFAIFVGLFSGIYSGFEDQYDVVDESKQDGYNVIEQLHNLRIISGLGLIQGVFSDTATPTGSNTDILGSLAALGIGILNSITGVFTFPFEIIDIVLSFYEIPQILVTGIQGLLLTYVGFLLISAYLGRDI